MPDMLGYNSHSLFIFVWLVITSLENFTLYVISCSKMSKSKSRGGHKDHRRGGRHSTSDRTKQRDHKFDEERFVLDMQAAIDGKFFCLQQAKKI